MRSSWHLSFIAVLALSEPCLAQKLVDPKTVAPEYREAAAKRREEQIAQLECRHRAAAARVLPRDRTAHIIRCLAEFGEKPTTTAYQ